MAGRRKRSRRDTLRPAHALFVCALDAERDAIEHYLKKVGAIKQPRSFRQEEVSVDHWILPMRNASQETSIYVKCLGSAGNGFSGIQVMQLLPEILPRFIFVFGIGGSLNPEIASYGSVVSGGEIDWAVYTKIETDEDGKVNIGRMKVINSYQLPNLMKNMFDKFRRESLDESICKDTLAFDLIGDMAKKLTDWAGARSGLETEISLALAGKYKLIVGKIFSWDYVLNSEGERKRLHDNDALRVCVEMESGAVSYAVKHFNNDSSVHPCALFVFRGISDLAHKKVDSPWQKFAAHAAARCSLEFYRSLLPEAFAVD